MRSVLFTIVLLLLFAGNCFGTYQLFSNPSLFLAKFPKFKQTTYAWFRWLPVVNLIALAGIWRWQRWAPWLIIICSIVVIFCDVYFNITYHLYAAVASTLILLFLIIKHRTQFG